MLKRFFQVLVFTALGAATSLTTRAFAGDGGDTAASCGKCGSSIGIWNEVFNVTLANGNTCQVWTIWWRKDGDCQLSDLGCTQAEPCKFIVQTNSSCGAGAGQLMYQVSSGGLLNFSTAVPATYIVGLECDKQIQFTSCVINTWTGEAVCRTNYAGCGPCPQGPIE